MAQLRLIAVFVAGSAVAGIPAHWARDPELAKAAASSVGDGITVTASDAWSEPSRGCYAFSLGVKGVPGPIDQAADQLVAEITKLGATTRDVQKPAVGERGTLSLGFDKAPYHGKLRADLAKTGEVSAVACVWSEREPKVCEAGCAELLK
ncbi:MAG TPA: hypothetical protein VGC41_19375 [Kofleriaceae bacterium]